MDLERINEVLESPLNKLTLSECLKLSKQLLEQRTQAQKKLFEEHNRLRYPKDKEYTDFDRQSMINAAVADLHAQYELLKGYEDLMNTRISLLSAAQADPSNQG